MLIRKSMMRRSVSAYNAHEKGEYAKAKGLYEATLDYWQRRSKENHAYILHNLALTLWNLGEEDAALIRLAQFAAECPEKRKEAHEQIIKLIGAQGE